VARSGVELLVGRYRNMVRPCVQRYRHDPGPVPAPSLHAAGDSCHSRGLFRGRRVPGLATARHANRAASNTGRKVPSGRSRSPLSLPASCAGTCRLSVAQQMGGCPGRSRRPGQRKPLRPDLAPGPRRSHAAGRDRRPAGAPPLRSASCRAVVVAGLRRPARRSRCPGRAQVRVLFTIYAHCIPGCDQIASQHVEQALRPSQWPRAGPQEPAWTPGIPSVMRPCHSWTQRDTAGPETSAQIRLHVCDLRKYRPGRPAPRITAADSRSWALRSPKPLTRPDLPHNNRERSTEPLLSALEPLTQLRVNGSELVFAGGRCWVRTNVG
jgi:hypothetical protein